MWEDATHPLLPLRRKKWQKKLKSNRKSCKLPAGKANPAPPVGPALASHGINIMAFCKDYNGRTQQYMGQVIPAEITVFTDGSYSFVLKSPPTSELLKKAAGVPKGSSEPNRDIVATITRAQLREVAEQKMKDLNAYDVEMQ